MRNECVFIGTGIAFPSPGKFVIAASLGKSVVTHGKNLVVTADYAASDLSARILAAKPGKMGYAHEIFIPAYIIFSLFIIHHLVPKILSPASPSPGTI